MRFLLQLFIVSLLFTGLGWGLIIVSTMIHEDVHSAIFTNYNVSSTITVNRLTGGGFTTPNSTEYHLYCTDDCKFLNSMNEIISYNLDIFVFAVIIGMYLIMIIVLLIFNARKDEILLSKELPELNLGEQQQCAESSDMTGITSL